MITSVPGDTEMYGVEVSKLQSGVRADSEGVLHGTLYYVTGYEGFNPSNPDEQSGNYCAMHIHTPVPGKVSIQSSTMQQEKELDDEDRDLVWRVKDNKATLTIKVKDDGGEQIGETTYKASGLTLEQSKD